MCLRASCYGVDSTPDSVCPFVRYSASSVLFCSVLYSVNNIRRIPVKEGEQLQFRVRAENERGVGKSSKKLIRWSVRPSVSLSLFSLPGATRGCLSGVVILTHYGVSSFVRFFSSLQYPFCILSK